MTATPRTAWLRTEKGCAIICARCPDKLIAEQRATRAGLMLSHGLCPECAETENAAIALFFAQESREKPALQAQGNQQGVK